METKVNEKIFAHKPLQWPYLGAAAYEKTEDPLCNNNLPIDTKNII
jgi:hypothetical protein